jgi:hypothetical protein
MDKTNIITVIYNPCLFINKYLRIKKNIEDLIIKNNIELFIVESCYKDQGFIFTNQKNKNHLQIKIDIPLFHTDNMLNLAINKLLPNDWKSFIYIDADTDFLEDNWVDKIVLNQRYDIIQLNGKYENDSKQIGIVISRKAWENINYFYDKSIIGMGNIIFMYCLLKNINNFIKNYNCTINFAKDLLKYQINIHKNNYKYLIISIDYNIKSYIDIDTCVISQIIHKYNFNPNTHIIYDLNGYIKPSNDCPKELLNEIIAIELNNNQKDERIHNFNESKSIMKILDINPSNNDIINEILNEIIIIALGNNHNDSNNIMNKLCVDSKIVKNKYISVHIHQKIIVFVPYCKVYEPFIIKCLSSIKYQNYPNYEVIIINDGSKNIEIVNEFIKDFPNYLLINFIDTNDSLSNNGASINGPAFSKWKFIEYIQKNIDKYNYNDIVIIIDGDDHVEKDAFSTINNTYQLNNCWFTYGNALGKYCEGNNYDISNTWKNIRKEKWIYNHPRTCKLFLLTKFIENDFKIKDKWLIKATDRVFVYNCIEWATKSKCKFINKILYNYIEHDNNTYKIVNRVDKELSLNYIINQKQKDPIIEDIHIVMCCWKRIHMLEQIVQNMNDQTVSNRINFHIINNNKNNIEVLNKMINNYKNKYKNIKLYLSHYDNKYYCFQRFMYIRDILIKNYNIDYVIIIDDDQIFSKNWVENIYKLRKPKSFITWYGKLWDNKINYWTGTTISISDCTYNKNSKITEFSYGAPCGCIIDVNIFNKDSLLWNIPNDLPPNISIYNIDDMWLSFIIIYEYGWKIYRSFLPPLRDLNKENNKCDEECLYKILLDNKQILFEYLYNKYIFNSVKSNI